MAGWREPALLLAALWMPTGAVMASGSVPAAQAENAKPSPRAGWIQARPAGVALVAALQDAVREDAWRAGLGSRREQLQVQAERVTWADGSLGCPQPGVLATQALVPGWRLVVRGPAGEAVYHASERGQWLLCASGSTPPARPGDVTR